MARHFPDLVTALIGDWDRGMDISVLARRINSQLQERSNDCLTGSVLVTDYKQHPNDKPRPDMYSRAGGEERSSQVFISAAVIGMQAIIGNLTRH
jgi:hypothetical protein